MKECVYCKKPMKDGDTICMVCGYDHDRGAINTAIKTQADLNKNRERGPQTEGGRGRGKYVGVSSMVKQFAFIGLAIVVFSIFYKYNFNINDVILKVKQTFGRLKTGKIMTNKAEKKQDKKDEKIEWLNVGSFEEPKKPARYRDLTLEGIFFDPDGKSFVTINSNVVGEGDALGNIIIKKINKDSVEVIADGEIKIIELKQQ